MPGPEAPSVQLCTRRVRWQHPQPQAQQPPVARGSETQAASSTQLCRIRQQGALDPWYASMQLSMAAMVVLWCDSDQHSANSRLPPPDVMHTARHAHLCPTSTPTCVLRDSACTLATHTCCAAVPSRHTPGCSCSSCTATSTRPPAASSSRLSSTSSATSSLCSATSSVSCGLPANGTAGFWERLLLVLLAGAEMGTQCTLQGRVLTEANWLGRARRMPWVGTQYRTPRWSRSGAQAL
jgi:hypothetical protein